MGWGEASAGCLLSDRQTGVNPGKLPRVAERMHFSELPPEGATAATFHELPAAAHRDPFDRLVVGQAIRAGRALISKDAALDAYADMGLKRIW